MENCINSYLTLRKFLVHPNTCKLLNEWHQLNEKKNMMLVTAEWRKKKPPPPKQVPKTASVVSSRKYNVKNQPQAQNKGKGKAPATKTYSQGYRIPEHLAGCHGECISYGQSNDGITEKGGSQIKVSEMISDIFDSIPELYEAINDMKTHVSDENSSICNNLKTNNLSLSQIKETLMCFGKALRTIKASNNENSFGNKFNEQSAIIKELTDKYSKFNIYDII
ncbi:hypothetical protein O181_072068 [Austropuccinia psidii MF-1]|uniref:Uncharacterized protein n=1 Tax=Austropuccinia psidii MF-1 TaxID=1389203 RepID=A0A9Q3F287_9BASI|nr:hypothetical protein [Austropuccinia psidii MF-1]